MIYVSSFLFQFCFVYACFCVSTVVRLHLCKHVGNLFFICNICHGQKSVFKHAVIGDICFYNSPDVILCGWLGSKHQSSVVDWAQSTNPLWLTGLKAPILCGWLGSEHQSFDWLGSEQQFSVVDCAQSTNWLANHNSMVMVDFGSLLFWQQMIFHENP